MPLVNTCSFALFWLPSCCSRSIPSIPLSSRFRRSARTVRPLRRARSSSTQDPHSTCSLVRPTRTDHCLLTHTSLVLASRVLKVRHRVKCVTVLTVAWRRLLRAACRQIAPGHRQRPAIPPPPGLPLMRLTSGCVRTTSHPQGAPQANRPRAYTSSRCPKTRWPYRWAVTRPAPATARVGYLRVPHKPKVPSQMNTHRSPICSNMCCPNLCHHLTPYDSLSALVFCHFLKTLWQLYNSTL